MKPSFFGTIAGAGAASPIALVASVAADAPDGITSVTAPINTTGATLLVAMTAYYVPGGVATLTDSKSNTWTALTLYAGANGAGRMYYCKNPVVGTGHTFTLTDDGGGADYNAVAVAAFSGTNTAENADGDNGATNASTATLQPGSITPSLDNSVVVTGLMFNDNPPSGNATINGGFTVAQSKSSAVGYSVAIAYLVQATAAAANPTWTGPRTDIMTAAISSFKQA